MKIVLINGSPRKNGNTQSIINLYGEVIQKQFLNQQCEIKYVSLAQQSIELCHGCRACMENFEEYCPCKDETKNIEKLMVWADVIIIGSPVYVEDISGLMKVWVDRMAYHSHRPFLDGKLVYLFTTSGAKASKHTIKTLNNALVSWGARIIGSNNYSMGIRMEKDTVKQRYMEAYTIIR